MSILVVAGSLVVLAAPAIMVLAVLSLAGGLVAALATDEPTRRLRREP